MHNWPPPSLQGCQSHPASLLSSTLKLPMQGAGKMVQRLKVHTVLTRDPSSTPSTHARGFTTDCSASLVPLASVGTCIHVYIPCPTHIHISLKKTPPCRRTLPFSPFPGLWPEGCVPRPISKAPKCTQDDCALNIPAKIHPWFCQFPICSFIT